MTRNHVDDRVHAPAASCELNQLRGQAGRLFVLQRRYLYSVAAGFSMVEALVCYFE